MKEIRIELMAQTSAKAVLEHIWSFDVDCQSNIIIFMWCWWSARNKINAGEKTKTAQQIINDVFFFICRHGGMQLVLKKELQFQSANQNGDHHPKRFTRLTVMQLTTPIHVNLDGVSS
jgi:hypothetical protein